MIDYNPKEWFRYIFYFQKADTVRKLAPMILTMAVYSSVVAYIIIIHLKITENNDLKNISLMHSLLGFVISMLLVFRTNTAYDRWWEGRKQWGSLVNGSRNLALKIAALIGPEYAAEREFFTKMIPNYAFALKNHLRNHYRPDEFEDTALYKKSSLITVDHIPNQIAAALFAKVIELQRKGALLPEHTIILNHELEGFTNICGACERIKNTPIPLSYSSFIKKFIFIYCLTLPIGYVFSLHFLVVPFVMFVFYILASLEVIAEEIEDPFGEDVNDLPMERICKGIHTSTRALLK
nr:bestrophin family ion channel [uncultured Dyadobacter sp.]